MEKEFKKMVDLKLNIDGLLLKEDESVEGFVESIDINSMYPITYEILNEEDIE